MLQPKLYVVATPIGNLGDFSPRAKEILADVDFIACEDTRHSYKLMQHFNINTPLESLHAFNEQDKSSYLIQKLHNSPKRLAAIITDAGTPCISDPGSKFIAEAKKNNVQVIAIPGPSSLVAALSVCGFIQPRIIFSAFLERSEKERKQEFSIWEKSAPCIAVFFESPHRIVASLTSLKNHFSPTLEVCVAKELSKIYEEHLVDTVENLLAHLTQKEKIQGEFVVCVNLNANSITSENTPTLSLEEIAELAMVEIKNNKSNLNSKEIIKAIALQHKLDGKMLYKKVQELKNNSESLPK